MRTNKFVIQVPGRKAGLMVLALAGVPARAAADATPAASLLPLLLLLVPLLLAVAFALRAWFPRLWGTSSGGGQARTIDWPRMARLSGQFFEAHGLAGFDPQAPWEPARDLVLHRDRHACVVRARLWRARQVDAAAVQQLVRDVAGAGASRGILLCAHDVFTPAARQLARQQGILLLDATHMPTRATPRTAPAQAPVRPSAPGESAGSAPAAPATAPLLRSAHAVRGRRQFQPTEPLETQSGDLSALAPAEQHTLVLPRKAPLLADPPLTAARRQFQPTEPLETQPGDLPTLAPAEQPTLVLPRRAPLLADPSLTAARRQFQPTEPLETQPGDLPTLAPAEQPTLVLPRRAHRVADRPHAVAPREFQGARPQRDETAAVPNPCTSSRRGERPIPSRRDFLPTAPMPVSGLAAL
ncbi:MAG TPA: restriction endonuclease [Ottowia sp.]|uniref:restriction endonuclease n=1 Tax=Ottowia sp. TaxID=1898956 RepID=UPI002CD91EAA|nr:restriction endonuclease [Ottowia sp.]HMN19959.1 restriction endonuclease [Ottowia sp.]